MNPNKKKIFNDPIYGFITIPGELIFDIIEHPYFQRLRRIRQLGLTDLVYPGALHTRFHHALGAMHLMGVALHSLRSKGHEISDEEFEAAQIAVLLHDIGHGPFSHALESTLLSRIPHEELSLLITEDLNLHFNGALKLAIKMFRNTYKRKFFHQLISSQLDIDRLDYLKRDSFFTGVSEGTIGANRIIKMMNIANDRLVIEEKGIYSIEHFLTARRLMYWQVYLHKATVSAEKMMIQTILRARDLVISGTPLFSSPALQLFLEKNLTLQDFKKGKRYLEAFTNLDDFDIWGAIKIWQNHNDKTLAFLCNSLLNRKLFRIEISGSSFNSEVKEKIRKDLLKTLNINKEHEKYYLIHGTLSNAAYISVGENISILTKKGRIVDVAEASDLPSIQALGKIVKKHYLCWPKNVYLHDIYNFSG